MIKLEFDPRLTYSITHSCPSIELLSFVCIE